MKTIIILAHPNIEQSNINKSWLETLSKSNPEIYVHNIYKAYPNWQIDVASEQALLLQYDRVIFQYPFQWYNMPPLLKKWLDDVFLQGWAYGTGGENLQNKEFGVVISTAGIDEVYTDSVFGKIEDLLKPLVSTVKFVGGKYISYHTFNGAYTPDVHERLPKNIEEYLKYVTQ